MVQTASDERPLFFDGPPIRLGRLLGLVRADRRWVRLAAAVAVLVGWLPLVVLVAVDAFGHGADLASSFLQDYAVHARSLVAAPMLVLAHSFCVPRLEILVRYLALAGFVPDRERDRFADMVASTRRL